MKLTSIKTIMAIAVFGFFSQFAMADDASSATEIARIVVSMNHFPSDEDKARLMAISADESLVSGVREMATAVTNIAHAANDEGKAAMANIIDDDVPDRAKVLAGAIAGFNHTVSDEDKAKISELYEL